MDNKYFIIFKKLSVLLPQKYKIWMIVLVLLVLVLSIIETISVSVVMPFISIATNQSLIDTGVYKQIFDFLNFTDKNKFIIIFGFSIMGFYLFRVMYNVLYNYIISRFSYGIVRYVNGKLFRTYLTIPYVKFTQRNSSELTQHITTESTNVGFLILGLLQMCSESFIVISLYCFMLVQQWKITLVLTVILGCILFFVLMSVLKICKKQGIKRAEAYKNLYKILGESFGNFRFIKIKGSAGIVFSDFSTITQHISRSHIIHDVLSILPRCILESFGFAIIIGMINFMLWYYQKPDEIIGMIALYALSLYRILPSVNRILFNINKMTFFQKSLELVYDDMILETEEEGNDSITFDRVITIKELSFSYVKEKTVLRDISLTIKKGDKLAITGESGSGKSTLIDLLVGIHKPADGTLLVDDVPVTDKNIRAWRSKIGYIPQSIYLFDGTVGENVSFGSLADTDRIIEVLQMAKIWNFLDDREGIHTKVGEGGIQLSGGQKQRIGIARALYTNPDVLVLDEATSALNSETEEKIMDEVYNLSKDKTLIVIAHRLTTIERCDRRIQIEGGKIAV